MDTGYTVHVGDDAGYLALYRPQGDLLPAEARYRRVNGLNTSVSLLEILMQLKMRLNWKDSRQTRMQITNLGDDFIFLDNTGLEFEIVHYDD